VQYPDVGQDIFKVHSKGVLCLRVVRSSALVVPRVYALYIFSIDNHVIVLQHIGCDVGHYLPRGRR